MSITFRSILVRMIHWLFPSRQRLDRFIQHIMYYRKRANEFCHRIKQLEESLRASNLLFHRSEKAIAELRSKVTGHEITIHGLTVTVARLEQIIAEATITMAIDKKTIAQKEEVIEMLGLSLTKVYQQRDEDTRAYREENARLMKTIADRNEQIKNLLATMEFYRRRLPWGF